MNFWLWFGIFFIFINRTLNLQGIKTLLKISHLFKNDKQKNMICTGTIVGIYHNKLQKNCSKIHSYEKVFLGKRHVVFF